MTISATAGPHVAFGANPALVTENNPERGPSCFDCGMMLLDPRAPFTYATGQGFGSPTRGFVDGSYIVLDQAPSAISAVNIAASQSPAASNITLVSATGAGVTAGVSITRSDTNVPVTGLLALDGAMGAVSFGSAATIQAWDPTKALSRNVRITSGGNDSGITFKVSGYDIYGYPMSETITGANAGIATGRKAFKYISGVTKSGASAGTIAIGTGDVYGLPLRVSDFFYTDIFWNGAFVTASTGFTVADATSPATATTGDVRGTYAVQSASDGTKKLQMCIAVSVANLNAGTTGLFGVTQA